jgi:drug/metabolite transporter (DMT)-like permease
VIAAIVLSLLSAVLNATWNALLKVSGDPMVTATRAETASTIAATPLLFVTWLVAGRPPMPPAAWGLAGASAVFEFIYFLCLTTAYRRGELSVVYPLARGSAPLLAVAAGVLLLGEGMSARTLVGVAFLMAGILIVRRPSRAAWTVMWPALLTGAAIATYSAIDKVGTQQAPPWLYGWAMWSGTALLLAGWAGLVRTRGRTKPKDLEIEPSPTPPFQRAALIGGLMLASYFMVLIALRLAPLVVVAPLRESGIVLVTGVSAWRLGERTGLGTRLVGSVSILCGAILLAT